MTKLILSKISTKFLNKFYFLQRFFRTKKVTKLNVPPNSRIYFGFSRNSFGHYDNFLEPMVSQRPNKQRCFGANMGVEKFVWRVHAIPRWPITVSRTKLNVFNARCVNISEKEMYLFYKLT